MHVLGCSDDEVADFRVELFEGHVGFGGGLLEHAEGPNHAGWHGVVPDVKIEQRTSGLAAIISVAGHFQFTHRIGFNSHVSFRSFEARGTCALKQTHQAAMTWERPLLNQLGNGGRASVFPTFTDLSVKFFCQGLGDADADDSAVAGTMFSHASMAQTAFNKYNESQITHSCCVLHDRI